MSQRQVSPNYLFELIGRLQVELNITKMENDALVQQLQDLNKNSNPQGTTSQAP